MKPQPTTLHYLISATVTDHGQFDPDTMRVGLTEGISIAKRECMLTKLDDETSDLSAISVASIGNVVEGVKLILGDSIEQGPEATAAIAGALKRIQLDFARDRLKILSADERSLLLSGIGWSRKEELGADEKPSTKDLDGRSDEELIEVAFLSAGVMRHYPDSERVAVLTMLASNPRVLDVLHAVDPHETAEIVSDLADSHDNMIDQQDAQAVQALAETIVGAWRGLRCPQEPETTDAPGM